MQDVIYFDNAATSWPKPAVVAERMTKFLNNEAANPGRAGHRMAVAAEQVLDSVRKQLSDFIGGSDPQRLIFTMNATDALNIAIKGILRSGDHVITSTLEHNSVSRPLQTLADANIITLTRIDFSPQTGIVDPQDFQNALTPKTRLVVLTHASNVLGTIQPVADIGGIIKQKAVGRTFFLVDAAQTIGTVPINIPRSHIDLLAFPGHKSLLGPTGTGGLYVGPTVNIDDLQPLREGGTGGDSSSTTMPKQFPFFLEGGTPNTVGIAGLGAAVNYIIGHHPEMTRGREQAMAQLIIDLILSNPRFTLYGPKSAASRVGTLSFNIHGYTPQEVSSILDESFEIAVRPGLHCSPYAHRTLGTFPNGTIRVSPGHFNTSDEVAVLLDSLTQLAS